MTIMWTLLFGATGVLSLALCLAALAVQEKEERVSD
jgi:hypothetical protein